MAFRMTAAKAKVLNSLIEHGNANPSMPFLFFKQESMEDFLSHIPPLVLCNANSKNDRGEIAFVISPDGVAKVNEYNEKQAAKGENAPAPVTVNRDEITVDTVDDFAVPTVQRRTRESIYPYETIAPPVIDPATGKQRHSGFFVPLDPNVPDHFDRLKKNVAAKNSQHRAKAKKDSLYQAKTFAIVQRDQKGVPMAFIARIS